MSNVDEILNNNPDPEVEETFYHCLGKCSGKGKSHKMYTVKALISDDIIACMSQLCDDKCPNIDDCVDLTIQVNP